MVNPIGNLGHGKVLAFAGRSVHHDRAADGLAAKQADREVSNGANPPRVAFVVDFERLLSEHIEGIFELHVAVDVARQGLAFGVLDGFAFLKAHHLGILRGHVHDDIGRDALLAVLEPLEQIGIAQRAHAHRMILIVDLAIQGRDLELAYQVGHRAHRAVAQQHGGIAVDDGNLIVVHLLYVVGERRVLGLQHIGVFRRIAREERRRKQRAHQHEGENHHRDERQEFERLGLAGVRAHLIGAMRIGAMAHAEDEERRQQDEHGDERPRVGAVDVDGRMEPPVRHRQHDNRHDDADDDGLPPHVGELVFDLAILLCRLEIDMRYLLTRALTRIATHAERITAQDGEKRILVA